MAVLWSIWQSTWGFVQSLVGLVVFCGYRWRDPAAMWFWHRGTVVMLWSRRDGLSLGLFVFVSRGADDAHAAMNGEMGENDKERVLSELAATLPEPTRRMLAHELGHCVQSALLGPLYLPIIGVPSLVWCRARYFARKRREKALSYYDFYSERWANACGKWLEERKL